jgi:uncharacterized beta-barrel protein YwiB (DUF1934 family)
MTEEVSLVVAGSQPESEDGDNTVTTVGRYRKVGDYHFIKYHDQSLEGADANVLLRFSDGHFELSKSGDIGMHLLFEEGRTFNGEMTLPYGSFDVQVTTEKLELVISEDVIKIECLYDLSIDGNHVSRSKVSITAKARRG